MSTESAPYRAVTVRADDLSVLLNIASTAQVRGLIGDLDAPAHDAVFRCREALRNDRTDGAS